VCRQVYSDRARKSIRDRTTNEPFTDKTPNATRRRERDIEFRRDFACRYCSSESILNIGRYIAMMITPTIAPTAIIISGSMMDVSDWIDESTSSS
jgi:hypothetical protein